MNCSKCNSPTSVVDSRAASTSHVVRRRRKCQKCGFSFTTYEFSYVDLLNPDQKLMLKVMVDLSKELQTKLTQFQDSVINSRPLP